MEDLNAFGRVLAEMMWERGVAGESHLSEMVRYAGHAEPMQESLRKAMHARYANGALPEAAVVAIADVLGLSSRERATLAAAFFFGTDDPED